MVPFIINPIYTLYSVYSVFIKGISLFKGLVGGLKPFTTQEYHHFPYEYSINLLRYEICCHGSFGESALLCFSRVLQGGLPVINGVK